VFRALSKAVHDYVHEHVNDQLWWTSHVDVDVLVLVHVDGF
jgi:hypothetical protein